jgi:allophanate hydrolase
VSQTPPPDLCLTRLRTDYLSGSRTPASVIAGIITCMNVHDENPIWIHRIADEDLLTRARELEGCTPEDLPLYGIPFAVKDNIDVAGLPTSASCPDFTYTPKISAPAVEALLDAGAILIGKTNLDQFATGLVGTRSPWGACRNAFDRG